MTTPTIKIETLTHTQGKKSGQTFYSVWFWLDNKAAHIGYFNTKREAEWAGEAVMKAVELTRQAI